MARTSSNSSSNQAPHVDPDELMRQAEEAKAKALAEHETVKRAVEAVRDDPATAAAYRALEDLRAQHRALFAQCERDSGRVTESKAARAAMFNMLKSSSPTKQDPPEGLLPPVYHPDPRVAKRLHELAYEIAAQEKALGLVAPSEREQQLELTRALIAERRTKTAE